MKKTIDSVFITGTDTGIGKTVLSLLVMQYLHRSGLHPFYIKPFQTGCRDPYDSDSDAKFIYEHLLELNGHDPANSVVYCLKNPKAPMFAALDQQMNIDLETVIDNINEKKKSCPRLVIEGAGGLMVPIDRNNLMIDFINKLDIPVILAARSGLGTINHTLLSIEALNKRNFHIAGILFMHDGVTPIEMVQENMNAVKLYSGIEVAGLIDRITDFTNPPETALRSIQNIFKPL